MADSSFTAALHEALRDPSSLPQEFLDYMVQYAAQNPVPAQSLIAPSHKATGLGDATQGSRFIGATNSGHPTKGYFQSGDFCVDKTGSMWVCTVSGNPGTWVQVGGVGGTAPGTMVQTYQGVATSSDFVWTGPAGTNVSSGYPVNNIFTKQHDETAILIVSEGDFTAGTAPDYITMGLWIDGNNEINVASHVSVTGGFASVQLARNISPTSVGTGPLATGNHTLDMKVSSLMGTTTTFRCHSATDLTIIEYFPAS